MNVERPLRLAQAVLGLDRIVYAHYAVTHRCCLRCRSCAIWKRGDADAELSLDQIRELTRVLARLGCLQISLSGGEPTLRADLPEIVRAFQAAGIRTRVLTRPRRTEPLALTAPRTALLAAVAQTAPA